MKHFSLLLKLILMASALMYARHTSAQASSEPFCGQHSLTQALYHSHPGLQQQVLLHEQALSAGASSKKTTSNPIVIPVVVHVLHQYGYENISDASIRASIDRFSTDFLMQNADTAQVVHEFQAVRASANIEFRLAKLDPNGNCTNGITRTVTSLTNLADDNSKIIQWDPHKYFNIWVVKSLNTSGIAAYAYNPAIAAQMQGHDGMMVLAAYMDGIIISAFRRAATHEVGHWLGLQDVWGTGPVGVACGDDGLSDTPITMGFTSCSASAGTSICTPGIVENRQNFMDQSYCGLMFTQDQAQLIQSTMS